MKPVQENTQENKKTSLADLAKNRRPPRLPGSKQTGTQRVKGKRNRPEWILQQACVKWAELHAKKYPHLKLMLHPASSIGRTKAETEELQSLGVRKGAPRLLIPVRAKLARKYYNGLAIEIKSPSGCLSAEQEDWRQRLQENGYLYVVVRALGEFIGAIKDFHQT